jgi:glucose-6-phosphate 1-dehydrogenase
VAPNIVIKQGMCFCLVGIGRRDYNNEQFRDQVKASIQTYVKDTDRIDEFMTHVFYPRNCSLL